MSRKYDDAVEVTFNRFWIDLGADALRADLPEGALKLFLINRKGALSCWCAW
jgi:hypothetical protein